MHNEDHEPTLVQSETHEEPRPPEGFSASPEEREATAETDPASRVANALQESQKAVEAAAQVADLSPEEARGVVEKTRGAWKQYLLAAVAALGVVATAPSQAEEGGIPAPLATQLSTPTSGTMETLVGMAKEDPLTAAALLSYVPGVHMNPLVRAAGYVFGGESKKTSAPDVAERTAIVAGSPLGPGISLARNVVSGRGDMWNVAESAAGFFSGGSPIAIAVIRGVQGGLDSWCDIEKAAGNVLIETTKVSDPSLDPIPRVSYEFLSKEEAHAQGMVPIVDEGRARYVTPSHYTARGFAPVQMSLDGAIETVLVPASQVDEFLEMAKSGQEDAKDFAMNASLSAANTRADNEELDVNANEDSKFAALEDAGLFGPSKEELEAQQAAADIENFSATGRSAHEGENL